MYPNHLVIGFVTVKKQTLSQTILTQAFKYLCAIIYSVLSLAGFSQNETAKWYFGNGAGLDFMATPPSILTNGALTYTGTPNQLFNEGTASIADANGNLLFYTDGVTAWNQLNVPMANGTGLFGSFTTSQSALIVKQPGNSALYYVFTLEKTGGSNGLCYSIVDMSLAAGMGSVTVKNAPIYASATEKLCAVKHCNGVDVWIVSHEYNSNNFRANLLTAAGVNAASVISSIGTSITNTVMTQGCMKISPNGKKLGLAIYNSFNSSIFELYDFNDQAGIVSNSLSLGTAYSRTYGCEFSNDGSKFYGALGYGANEIHQWDLCAGSNAAIIASEYTISCSSVGQLQLAPNGKIYAAKINSGPLGVINNPGSAGAACNYVNQGQPVSPGISSYGLPNFVSSYFLQVPPFTYTVTPALSCLTASFTAPPSTNTITGCTWAGYNIVSVMWNFGDPLSGATNTSAIINPTHSYPESGIYNTQVILYNSCGGVIDTLKQQVVIGPVPVSSTQGFSVCAGETLTLTASGGVTYTWSTGAATSAISITPAANTAYTVNATDVNGCINKSIQTIIVHPLPILSVSGIAPVCAGDVVTLSAQGATVYAWNNGETTSAISVTPQATTGYTVTGSSVYGCSVSIVKTITVKPLPQLYISGNNTVCIGSQARLTVSGGISYVWSNGTTGSVINVSPIASMVYSVTGTGTNDCSNQATIAITVNQLPVLSIAGDNTVCLGSTITQTATGALTYSWNTGETTAGVSLVPFSNNTAYVVTGTDGNGCSNIATTSITVMPSPSLTVSSAVICSGGNAALSVLANDAAVVYKWYPSALVGYSITASAITTQIYTVIATAINGCTASANSTLSVAASDKLVNGFSYASPLCIGSKNILPTLLDAFIPGGTFFSDSLNVDESTGHVNTSLAMPGNYSVTYSLVINGCIGTGTAPVVLLPSPSLTLSPTINIAPGASTTLQVSGGNNYTWSPAEYLSCVECDAPIVTPPGNMLYCVSSSQGNCFSEACINVVVSCESSNDLSVPNAFTPNGDHNNDEFCLQGWNECITNFNVMIFNRWGEKVFESVNSSFCWDGIYKGKLLDAAVFIYVITAKKFNSVEGFTKKGNITLIR